MHGYQTHGGTTFNYNSDFSGNVKVQNAGMDPDDGEVTYWLSESPSYRTKRTLGKFF